MKTIRVIILFAVAIGQAVLVHAEFRAGIAVRIVTPEPLLPVSGGVGPSSPVTKKKGDLPTLSNTQALRSDLRS